MNLLTIQFSFFTVILEVMVIEMDERTLEISRKATISAIVKRKNAMKILLFLNNSEDVFYLQEIADNLDMNEMTAWSNLSRLIDAEIVRKTETKVDSRTKYYEVIDKKLAEKVIDKYKYRVSFHLARFVPYKKITTEAFKSDKRFIETCQTYGLSISEGINAVTSCPKIGSETHSGRSILWRKEQGYIPPEKTPEQLLEEAKKAIE